MIPSDEPAAAAPAERLDRVAELLATAILRLALRRRKELASPQRLEAACALVSESNANQANKESA
jgi:hypothetical protein